MLLILNCLLEPKSARVFEKEMARLMDKASLPYRVVRMAEVAAIADLPSYSHLLLLVPRPQPWTKNPGMSCLPA